MALAAAAPKHRPWQPLPRRAPRRASPRALGGPRRRGAAPRAAAAARGARCADAAPLPPALVATPARTGLAALAAAAALCAAAPGAHAARSAGRVGGRSFARSAVRSASSGASRGARTGSSFSAGLRTRSLSRSHAARRAGRVGGVAPTRTHAFFPFFLPFGFGLGYGGFGGGGLFQLVFMAALVYGVTQQLQLGDGGGGESFTSSERSTVLRVQVGLLGSARQLQSELDRIADRADTSRPSGLSYVLTEVCLSLLRNPDYWTYASADSKAVRTIDEAEAGFNRLSLEERSKFEEETLVNVDDRRATKSAPAKGDGQPNEYIVVTILASVGGKVSVPKVIRSEDLRTALTNLAGVPVEQLQAVEILWTPQDVNDTLTSNEVVADYPRMAPLA